VTIKPKYAAASRYFTDLYSRKSDCLIFDSLDLTRRALSARLDPEKPFGGRFGAVP